MWMWNAPRPEHPGACRDGRRSGAVPGLPPGGRRVWVLGLCLASGATAQTQVQHTGTMKAASLASAPYGPNWLRGAPASDPANRRAFVASIGGTAAVYNPNSLETWTGVYTNCQAIYEHGNALDDPTRWFETGAGECTCWDTSTVNYGDLVIDLQATRTLARFCVFQVFDNYGKVTSVVVYSHASPATAPAATDPGWVQQGSTATTLGAYAAPFVSSPTMFTVTPFTTRFLKVRVFNNGSFGAGATWMELKGIKGFSQ